MGSQIHLGVAQMAARVIWDHEAAGSRPATESSCKRVLGCGRSSMAELRNVTPQVPVRLRPVTPKRIFVNHASRTRAAEYRPLKPECQGSSPWRRTSTNPSWRNRQTRRSQKPVPARACPFDSDRGDQQQQSGSSVAAIALAGAMALASRGTAHWGCASRGLAAAPS